MKAFQEFCLQIKMATLHDDDTIDVSVWSNRCIPAALRTRMSRRSEMEAAEKMRNDFVELQTAFSNFSVLGGLFAMAVFIENMIKLYSIAWAALTFTNRWMEDSMDC